MSGSDLTSVTLNDGNGIPTVGSGVCQIPPNETEQAVSTDLPREDIVVVTKLWNAEQGYDPTLKAFDASMARLGLDYLDLSLIHWPCPQLSTFVDTFKAFAPHCTTRAASGRSGSAISSRSIPVLSPS
jgi:2,5-diketo-D-gluconate reductase A